VNSLAYLQPGDDFPDGLIISGGKDTVIEVRQPAKGPEDNAEALLLGHGNNICALDVASDGKYIISGGWDSEARVWPVGKWESEVVLREHQGSVWGVLAYDSDTVITGCADKLIRVWTTSGKLVRTIRGTEDCVRALCRIPKGHQSGADFASAGNDGKIRFWTLSGQQVGQFQAHDSYIYSLKMSKSGEMFSSGEDRSVRVWKGSECQQTITHPAISVWDVAVCPENGDIVTGASDRIVRVFTRDISRAADAETTRQFEDSVKQSSIPQQSLPEVNKEELPGPEFLSSKLGTKEWVCYCTSMVCW
jgi:phospholipase A-2-activating protein